MISLIAARRCLIQRETLNRVHISIGRRLCRIDTRIPPSSVRFGSTSSASKSSLKKPVKYPEIFHFYSAGTRKTVFVGCLKVTTIFVLGFFCLALAPAYYDARDEPAWKAGVVLLLGLIPFIFVTYTTAGFVTHFHLRLPEFARQSKESLTRYVEHVPRHAKFDITTLDLIGRPRVSRARLSDLYNIRSRFGITRFGRDMTDEEMKRPWWAARPVTQYTVHGLVTPWAEVGKSAKRFFK